MEINSKSCPKCGNSRLKRWEDLDYEDKILVEKLPLNVEFTLGQRKAHLFCGRCWYEFVVDAANRNDEFV